MPTKRINWIDWSKAIAIYLVVLGHLVSDRGSEGMLHNFIYAFHMPFFFFISGYLFRVKEDNLKDLLKRIWKSLILPYICLNLISDIFLAPTWYLSRTWPVKELFLFLTADGHGEPGPTWFLICLAWVWIAAWYLLRLPRKYQYTILIGCAIVAYYFPYQLYWRIDTAAMVLPFFMVGNYYKGKKIVQIRGGTSRVLVFLLLLALTIGFVYMNGYTCCYPRTFGNHPLLYYPEAFTGIAMLIAFSQLLDNFTCRFLQVLSTGTIAIMGLHGITVLYLRTILNHLGIVLSFNLPEKVVFSLIVVIALYYPILWLHRYFPQAMGNRSVHGTNQ